MHCRPNPNGKILCVNHSFTHLTGYTAEDVFGKAPRVLRSGRYDEKFYGEMWRAIRTEGFWTGEIWNKRKTVYASAGHQGYLFGHQGYLFGHQGYLFRANGKVHVLKSMSTPLGVEEHWTLRSSPEVTVEAGDIIPRCGFHFAASNRIVTTYARIKVADSDVQREFYMTKIANIVSVLRTVIGISVLAIGEIMGAGLSSTIVLAEDLPATAKVVEGLALPDLETRQDKNRVYFVLPDEKPLPLKITLPRLANVVRSVHWIGEDSATMPVRSEPTEWTIDLSQRPNNSAAVIVAELDAPIELFNKSVIARPEKDSGIILLPAKYATTQGSKLRFEPQPHKNTVGYWSDEHDTAEWTFQCTAADDYEVDILQGCGKGHGGSRVTLNVAGQSLDFVVEETGHFQNFIWRTLGSVTLKASDTGGETMSLKLTPQSKPGGAVMDVRAIRLCPKGSQRTFEPELADAKLLPSKE